MLVPVEAEVGDLAGRVVVEEGEGERLLPLGTVVAVTIPRGSEDAGGEKEAEFIIVA